MKNINLGKKLLAYITAGAISLCSIPSAMADFTSYDDKAMINQNTYLFDNNRDDHEVLDSIDYGTYVDRILSDGEYTLVRNNKKLGFVSNDSIEVVDNNKTENYSYDELNSEGYTTDKVKIRTGPSKGYKKIDIIDNGTKLDILGKSDNGWYLVDYNNTIGFVCADYIDILDLDVTMEDVPSIVPYVTATTNVNIRREPSKESDDIGDLKKDDSLKKIRTLDNGWVEVEYNGSLAYINGKYVKDTYMIDDDLDAIVYFTKASKVINPYNNESYDVPQYETGYVYYDTGSSYFGIVDGKYGLFNKANVEKLKGKFVVIDISEQKLRLYENNTDNTLCCDVVTGKDKSPTSIGLFKVGSKDYDTYLVGPGYRSHVDYWIPFNHGQGMHDADWRNKFGGEIYHKKGSHGCVNMQKKDAKQIYNTLERGDKVLVKK